MTNFYSKPPTHIDSTHAISKFCQKFQNQIPRVSVQNFYIPGISTIHWIIWIFLKIKIWIAKKVIWVPLPGIQPRYNVQKKRIFRATKWKTNSLASRDRKSILREHSKRLSPKWPVKSGRHQSNAVILSPRNFPKTSEQIF